uniref:Acyltransferase n=1 Tax=Janibacter limosus TaxID=53458 RepID=A0AC61U6N9_9MICO|nr:acyltransferase [Janibacter limosus]
MAASRFTWWHWTRWVIANRARSHHHVPGYLRMVRARATTPGLVFEGPCFIGPGVQFRVTPGTGRLIVGAYTHIGGGSALRAHEGTLRIGAKTIIGIRNTFNTRLDIEVGEACLFADDVYVCDFDHVTTDLDVPIKDRGIVKSPVRFGDDVWVATKCVITRGTDIGAHSVVGAGAVVRGAIPPSSSSVGCRPGCSSTASPSPSPRASSTCRRGGEVSEREALDVLVAHIPATHTEEILRALFAVGAGAVGGSTASAPSCSEAKGGSARWEPPTPPSGPSASSSTSSRTGSRSPSPGRDERWWWARCARRTPTRSPPSTSSSTPPSDACGEGHPGPSWWSSIPMDSVSGLGPSPQSAPTTRAC